MKRLTVPADSSNERLDVFVAGAMPELSRSFIQKLCSEGKVTVNAKTAKVSQKLRDGDTVAVDFDMTDLEATEQLDLPIIYEDDDVLVINKPVGVLTHSKGAYNPEPTVATFLEKYWRGSKGGDRNGIVHRLDRATSGVMICAKTDEAVQYLQKQFNQRKVQKTYYAIVAGNLDPPKAIIDMPIARNPRSPKTFHASSLGKPAQTHYEVVEANTRYSLVKLAPQTGRTHQLRVHLAHLKHPIVGDTFYRGESADRLYLHAEKLKLHVPSGSQHSFTAPLSADFKEWMKSHAE